MTYKATVYLLTGILVFVAADDLVVRHRKPPTIAAISYIQPMLMPIITATTAAAAPFYCVGTMLCDDGIERWGTTGDRCQSIDAPRYHAKP